MAKSIVEGILNHSINENYSDLQLPTSSEKIYRIRKSWEDVKSQLGAFSILENAKRNCPVGYSVFDWNGVSVYSNSQNISPDINSKLYRVRKTWEDASSQIGAFSNIENARNACKEGYYVFDWNGEIVYSNKSSEVIENDKSSNQIKPESPIPEDISPLKGISNEIFIEYIGVLAKEDMKKTGILASITIAQAILESDWGQSELSLKANNLFGMKSNLSGNTWNSEWDGKIYAKWSKEEINGIITEKYSDFRAYDSVCKSIKDHSDYLCGSKNGNLLRYDGLIGEKDYKKAIKIIKDGGYATDSKYVDKIINLIENYNLDVFDMAVNPSDLNNIVDNINETNKILNKILKILENIYNSIKSIFNI